MFFSICIREGEDEGLCTALKNFFYLEVLRKYFGHFAGKHLLPSYLAIAFTLFYILSITENYLLYKNKKIKII